MAHAGTYLHIFHVLLLRSDDATRPNYTEPTDCLRETGREREREIKRERERERERDKVIKKDKEEERERERDRERERE